MSNSIIFYSRVAWENYADTAVATVTQFSDTSSRIAVNGLSITCGADLTDESFLAVGQVTVLNTLQLSSTAFIPKPIRVRYTQQLNVDGTLYSLPITLLLFSIDGQNVVSIGNLPFEIAHELFRVRI
jgi:hypothetical protein